MKKRIIFVDDEPAMLELFRLMFKPMEEEWELDYAKSGLEALAMMAQKPYEVIVTDMHMAGMNGAQLLNEVMERYPRTARLVLSGYSEQETVAKCVGAAHQYLMKPCDLATLRTTLKRVCALDVFLKNEKLKGLVSRMSVLPSLPAIYFKVLKELQSPYATASRIGELVATDPAMTAKLLQLVNSAFFGIAREISNTVDAVNLLGVSTVRSLALSIHAFSCFDQAQLDEISVERISNHCLIVGNLARKIAQMEELELGAADEAFISGLLHDLGKLMLAVNMPERYKSVLALAREKSIPLLEAEREVFSATHADVGAYLLGLWGLPVPIVEAVALHHQPLRNVEKTFTPLTAVHVANVLEHEQSADKSLFTPPQLDGQYLTDLGLERRLPEWRAALEKIRSKVKADL